MTRFRALVLVAALAPSLLVLLFVPYPLDLEVYRAGGHAVLSGTSLYGVRLGPYGFTYPPFAAMLFTGLAVLPGPLALVTITAGSLAALAAVVRSTCADLLRGRGRDLALVAGLIACGPVRGTFWNGQVNLVLAALVLTDLLGRTPPRWRGALVGVAAAIKLTPAIFVVYLLVSGRRREAARAGAAFAVVSVGTWVLLPGDSLRFWTGELLAPAGLGDPTRFSDQSLRGAALRLVGPSAAGPVWLLLAAVVALAGLRLATRAENEVLALGIVGVTGCLISPLSWMHHWVWCVPLITGLAATGRRRAALALLAVFGLLDRLPPTLTREWPATSWLLGNGYVLAVLVAGGAALWRARRAGSRRRPAGPAARPTPRASAPCGSCR